MEARLLSKTVMAIESEINLPVAGLAPKKTGRKGKVQVLNWLEEE